MARTAPFGDYTRAKLEFLEAAHSFPGDLDDPDPSMPVNIKWGRPLHPHGARMVRDGLFTLSRTRATGRKSSNKRVTLLTLTEKGAAELARLQRRADRAARRHQ